MKEIYVLDSTALLFYLSGTEGYEVIEEVIGSTLISSVNFSEVVAKLKERKIPQKNLIPCLKSYQLKLWILIKSKLL